MQIKYKGTLQESKILSVAMKGESGMRSGLAAFSTEFCFL